MSNKETQKKCCKMYSSVKLLVDKKGIKAGARGAVVETYEKNGEIIAYCVEIADKYGQTIELLDLLPEEFEVIWEPKD